MEPAPQEKQRGVIFVPLQTIGGGLGPLEHGGTEVNQKLTVREDISVEENCTTAKLRFRFRLRPKEKLGKTARLDRDIHLPDC